ncbi:DegV family protein [Lactobacillus sp. PV037]|uniref:DegV family protein n=1 Tax=Lactobacillus sp. PV037 TaxID=2594496 RepID=UPI00223FD16E|nr:DegV family protein [Lactobacillus sp. PV037]QNQ84326.1 DegV family protein [Lactobacillus sp. PV037]
MTAKILTDSSANLLTSECSGTPHENVPLTIQVGNKSWRDDGHIDPTLLKEALSENSVKTTTSCPNIHDWLTAFGDSDEIFVFTISGALSGSYNAAKQAATEYHTTHPKAKILVFDSHSAGPQVKLLAEKTGELIKEGLSFKEIVKKIEDYQEHLNLIFALQDLTNLVNSGRVSGAAAKVMGMLKLNVIGRASVQGKFESIGKARGAKKTYSQIVKKMIEYGYNGGKVAIDHVDNLAGAEAIENLLLSKFPDAKITIGKCGGLCSYYVENGGLMIGYESK